MGDTDSQFFQMADEERPISLDLMKRLLAAIEEWGKTHAQKNVARMREITLDGLLKTVTAICVYRELAAAGGRAEEVRAIFHRVNKEGPIAEEDEPLLPLRARRDVLLRNLEQAVRTF